MPDADLVSNWIDRYVTAWNSNDRGDIGELFTDDAEYFTEPFRKPWSGRDQIVKKWLAHKDEAGETTFSWEPVAIADDVAVVRGETTYPGETYSNLWVIKLNGQGRCHHFTEWWMKHPTRRSTG